MSVFLEHKSAGSGSADAMLMKFLGDAGGCRFGNRTAARFPGRDAGMTSGNFPKSSVNVAAIVSCSNSERR
jgi:hypothetical protein